MILVPVVPTESSFLVIPTERSFIVTPTERSFIVIPTERSDEGSLTFVRDDRDSSKILQKNTQITPSEVVESTVISQIPLMVGRISVKSEDLFERQRVIVA